MSGRAVEAAGDVDTLLLDKTGTITLGNRQAVEFLPAAGVDREELADAAQLASLADETPEGRSIVVLAKEQFGLRGSTVGADAAAPMTFVPFSAATRMSGVDVAATQIRKGAADAVAPLARVAGGRLPDDGQRGGSDRAAGRHAAGRGRAARRHRACSGPSISRTWSRAACASASSSSDAWASAP